MTGLAMGASRLVVCGRRALVGLRPDRIAALASRMASSVADGPAVGSCRSGLVCLVGLGYRFVEVDDRLPVRAVTRS